MARRKFADLIIAWAEGAEIQVLCGGDWVDVKVPQWDLTNEYRIKPKNIEVEGIVVLEPEFCRFRQPRKNESSNIKFEFDWESQKLINATLLDESD